MDLRESKYYRLYRNRLDIKQHKRVFVTRKNQTPLLHVKILDDRRVMQSKITGKSLPIPLTTSSSNHELPGHERLSCDSCHTGWAPQCYGCHVRFNPEGNQKDHLLGEKTKGRWIESRWAVQSELPTLGVTGGDKITTFIPGMNLTIKKAPEVPAYELRYFSSISAHTTQKKSRSCQSCHQDNMALGIIQKKMSAPQNPNWKTPIGWISEKDLKPGLATQPDARSFNRGEVRAIRKVGTCLNCHSGDDKIYSTFKKSLKRILPVCKK